MVDYTLCCMLPLAVGKAKGQRLHAAEETLLHVLHVAIVHNATTRESVGSNIHERPSRSSFFVVVVREDPDVICHAAAAAAATAEAEIRLPDCQTKRPGRT